MKIEIPKNAQKIINILQYNGYEGYVVGGCVRDSILGKIPKDWDICTNALAQQSIEIFKGFNIIETGLQHGTITIVIEHQPYEVTTFRTDGVYSDNRHPDGVTFVKNLSQDLSRRDFTINAMAYSDKTGIVDEFCGIDDLEKRTIKCVGVATERFNEDALRIMRGLRFASVLDFSIEKETSNAILNMSELLKNIAFERISEELKKLLVGDGVEKIIVDYYKVFAVIIPEIAQMHNFNQNNPYHSYDLLTHTAKCVANSQHNEIVALTMFLHDIGKLYTKTTDEKGVSHYKYHAEKSTEIAGKILKKLRMSNSIISQVTLLIKYHDYTIGINEKSVKKLLSKIGFENFELLLMVQRADILSQNLKYSESRLEDLEKISEICNEIKENNECICLKQLAINGKDLMDIGISNGKIIGETLNSVLKLVIENQVKNEKNEIIKHITRNMQ